MVTSLSSIIYRYLLIHLILVCFELLIFTILLLGIAVDTVLNQAEMKAISLEKRKLNLIKRQLKMESEFLVKRKKGLEEEIRLARESAEREEVRINAQKEVAWLELQRLESAREIAEIAVKDAQMKHAEEELQRVAREKVRCTTLYCILEL